MTTATRSVAVVAARLPDVDRRALSQAWFSALHLAEPSVGRTAAAPNAAPSPRSAVHRPRPDAAAAAAAPGAPVRPRAHAALPAPPPPQIERRRSGGELARRIERALVKNVARDPQRSAAIAIDAGDGRVHLLIRTDRTATRIVALCSPHLRERVDRALAHARFGFAAAGVRLEVAR